MSMTTVNRDSVLTAYEDVRNDSTEISWAVFKYQGNVIAHDSSGTDYEEFKEKFTEDERLFGYVRLTTGDELSKRSKFALIAWSGPEVSTIRSAKMGTDKLLVKKIISSFAIEVQTSDIMDIDESHIREELVKAGGANYGTGSRP